MANARISETDISSTRLREFLDYDPDTGVFHWRKPPPHSRVVAGSVAGKRRFGYVKITLGRREHFAHRIAWLFVHGTWPNDQIDHINGICDDNRSSNLREATCSQNQWNSKKPKTNTSGYKGVHWNSSRHKWRASIKLRRKNIHIGHFSTREAAHEARVKVARELHGEFARTE